MGEKLLNQYQKLLESNKKINQELKQGNTQLEQLLAASWEVMQAIESLPQPAGREIEQVQELLEELVELHQENQKLLRSKIAELREELSQVVRKSCPARLSKKKPGSEISRSIQVGLALLIFLPVQESSKAPV